MRPSISRSYGTCAAAFESDGAGSPRSGFTAAASRAAASRAVGIFPCLATATLALVVAVGPASAQQLIVTIPSGAPADSVSPQGLAFDSQGNLFIADSSKGRVQRIDGVTGAVSTVAGTGTQGFSGDGLAATQAQMVCPSSLIFDASGALYIADTCGNRVRKVVPGTGGLIKGDGDEIISTYAGTGNSGQFVNEVAANSTDVPEPRALAIDSVGNLYLTSHDPVAFVQSVRWIDSATATIHLATFNSDTQSDSLLFEPSGDVLFSWANGIGVVSSSGGAPLTGAEPVTPMAVPASQLSHNGFFRSPALAQDSSGGVYVVNSYAAPAPGDAPGQLNPAWVSRILPGPGGLTDATVIPYAGAASLGDGYTGDGGPPLNAQMNQPSGLAVDGADNLYIADTANAAVRAVIKATDTPLGTPAIALLDQHGRTSAVTITFDGGVTQAGATAVVVSQTAPALPPEFRVAGVPIFYDVVTSALFTGPVTVCVSPASLPTGAHLLHLNSVTGGWEDLTISSTPTRVCAQVNSLSPFVVVTAVPQNQPPAITSAAVASFLVGQAGAFTLAATGVPVPTLQASGLPPGLSFTDHGDGSGAIAGIPTSAGVFTVTVMASNGVGSAASQSLTVTVSPASSPAKAVSVTPQSIDFGSWRFPHLSAREITVKNVGTGVVNIGSVTITPAAGTSRDAFFDVSLCGPRLAPGKSCTILVFYVTAALGAQSATVAVVDDAAGGVQRIKLTATTLPW